MVGVSTEWWSALESWSPPAFVVGGIGLMAVSMAGSLDILNIVSSPGWLHTSLLLGGIWFLLLGLVGFYAVISGPASRLSLAGMVTSIMGWGLLSLTLLVAIVMDLTTQQSFANVEWGPPLLVATFLLLLASFLAYGIASIRLGPPMRRIGLLLLVPVVAFFGQAVLLASKILTGDVSGALQLGLAAVAAVALIAAGLLLRTTTTPLQTANVAADSTPE